jgi:hypothetical protein
MVKDPEPGDSVFITGTIKSISEGVAVVEVYRSFPVGLSVPVQCGALGHIERNQTADAAVSATGLPVSNAFPC